MNRVFLWNQKTLLFLWYLVMPLATRMAWEAPWKLIYLEIPAMCSGQPAWWGPAAGVLPSGQHPYVVAAHELATAYASVLGVSQLMPDQCTGQWHSYEDPFAMQTPPFSQGLGWQWSSSSHVSPVHPEIQEHRKSSPSISHTPPWWQGLGWQLSRSDAANKQWRYN